MTTSSLLKTRKSGLNIFGCKRFILVMSPRCLCGAKGCRKYLNWARCVAQFVDNLYLKTLCKPSAVISALVYNCTCTVTAPPLQGWTLDNECLKTKVVVEFFYGFNCSLTSQNLHFCSLLLPWHKKPRIGLNFENWLIVLSHPCNVCGSYFGNIVWPVTNKQRKSQ